MCDKTLGVCCDLQHVQYVCGPDGLYGHRWYCSIAINRAFPPSSGAADGRTSKGGCHVSHLWTAGCPPGWGEPQLCDRCRKADWLDVQYYSAASRPPPPPHVCPIMEVDLQLHAQKRERGNLREATLERQWGKERRGKGINQVKASRGRLVRRGGRGREKRMAACSSSGCSSHGSSKRTRIITSAASFIPSVRSRDS